MKILIVHNDYGKYSGEEAVVDKMDAIFRNLGYEVAQYRLTSAGKRETLRGKIHGFFAGVYSPSGVKGLREALRRERPDVVNVHNLYPFISPAALKECRKHRARVVMTVHNFRLMCPTGLFMRNGAPCELCRERHNEWSCLRHNCEHSWMRSIGFSLRNAAARLRHDYDNVDVFACITDFQRRKLIAYGIEPSKLVVIPNCADFEVPNAADTEPSKSAPDLSAMVEDEGGKYVGFCGRLSWEKGIDMILEVARKHPEIPFKLAGLPRDNEPLVDVPANVQQLGYITGSELKDFYQGASFMVMASRWYEGFPMSILEAAHYAKSTIGPDHGGFTEIIGNGEEAIGLLFAPGDVDALEAKVAELWNSPIIAKRLGERAREKLREQYTSAVISRKWQRIIEDTHSISSSL